MINYPDSSSLPCPTFDGFARFLVSSHANSLAVPLAQTPSVELIHLAQNVKMSFLILKSFLCADRADVFRDECVCFCSFVALFESTVEKEGKKQGIAHFHQKTD